MLQDYLRKLFENDKLTIIARLKKTDSVELNNGPDFLGVISADDPKGSSFTLQMAILDIDLDDEESWRSRCIVLICAEASRCRSTRSTAPAHAAA